VASGFRQMVPDDRERLDVSVARVSWLLGVSVHRYRELEEGEARYGGSCSRVAAVVS